MAIRLSACLSICSLLFGGCAHTAVPEAAFKGRYFSGAGDVEYLRLLDISRRMFAPDPEFQNLPMLYTPDWNGLVEGPRWNAWWVQNSYGPTYCALPFLTEPYVTFLQNSQDLWFKYMGDGHTEYTFDQTWMRRKFTWVPPDGSLPDCARPGRVIHKQGDESVALHDWPVEFTAAGALLQAELLLIGRDKEAIARYLPKLERCANFVDTRRDPDKDLFLAGPAANLLAPNYAAWKTSEGYAPAYLTGLSITYIAFLDRLIELEKMMSFKDKTHLYERRRELAAEGLSLLTTDEGYFIKYLDPDGTRHGVYGAEEHGYFCAAPNHDAICFDIVDDTQVRRIYEKIASIPQLRAHDLVITNYPSLDDMYATGGMLEFGRWVNGGHWSTCEARMIMAYYRLGRFDDARSSMRRMLNFAYQFQLDNPIKDFGAKPSMADKNPINLCYDSFGPAAAMVRGLFGYDYDAHGLELRPRIPPTVTAIAQHFPVRLGRKELYLSAHGAGAITKVTVNGRRWRHFDKDSVFLPYDQTPTTARIHLTLGSGERDSAAPRIIEQPLPSLPSCDDDFWQTGDLAELCPLAEKIRRYCQRLAERGLADTYEAAHARLALEAIESVRARQEFLKEGKLAPLPEAALKAANDSYVSTARNLCHGLEKLVDLSGVANEVR